MQKTRSDVATIKALCARSFNPKLLVPQLFSKLFGSQARAPTHRLSAQEFTWLESLPHRRKEQQ